MKYFLFINKIFAYVLKTFVFHGNRNPFKYLNHGDFFFFFSNSKMNFLKKKIVDLVKKLPFNPVNYYI